MNPPNLGRLLKTQEAAARLRVDDSTLRRWRQAGVGPRFLQIGATTYRYPARELEAWIAANLSRRAAS
ncbi:helix-turn-helix transcriptional regulator [Jiangella anatolica]|uniref:DNA-binding protein n=1 Tax=Jiangella anatolica TaxID=2670374 RepID=A0A2W2BGR7_9ACTN|nr:DNA-binding protein [Jiangella anatolica]